MTLEQRNAEILRMIVEQTKRETASAASARAVLIKDGIYTASGNLTARYGGGRKKAKSAA